MSHTFEDIININSLLLAWREFLRGKQSKKDVQKFQFHLMDSILALNYDLSNGLYCHGGYEEFNISDPKPRIIHKATVRDRLLHHAVYRVLYRFFYTKFISDSFSCRNNKGTHGAVQRFKTFSNIVSKNNTKTCWVLKCDIKKFFASINQIVLMDILHGHIKDKKIIELLKEIILSFNSGVPSIGLPLGNLTSQLFCNIYMNEFDQFVKHKLKVKHYIRFADDFVIFSESKGYLENLIPKIAEFLKVRLSLTLHPDKVFIKTLSSGVDFLGWNNFPRHTILRTKTKQRMLKKLRGSREPETFASYLGLLQHGKTIKIKEKILKMYDKVID